MAAGLATLQTAVQLHFEPFGSSGLRGLVDWSRSRLVGWWASFVPPQRSLACSLVRLERFVALGSQLLGLVGFHPAEVLGLASPRPQANLLDCAGRGDHLSTTCFPNLTGLLGPGRLILPGFDKWLGLFALPVVVGPFLLPSPTCPTRTDLIEQSDPVGHRSFLCCPTLSEPTGFAGSAWSA